MMFGSRRTSLSGVSVVFPTSPTTLSNSAFSPPSISVPSGSFAGGVSGVSSSGFGFREEFGSSLFKAV